MRRANGQFISNAELIKQLEQIKNDFEIHSNLLHEYKQLLKNSEYNLNMAEKQIAKYKDKLNIFSFILRLTELFLIPAIAIPFVAFFIAVDLESALNSLVITSKIYCFSCFIISIFIIKDYYGKE